MSPKPVHPAKKKAALALLEKGQISAAAIARIVGVSDRTVWEWSVDSPERRLEVNRRMRERRLAKAGRCACGAQLSGPDVTQCVSCYRKRGPSGEGARARRMEKAGRCACGAQLSTPGVKQCRDCWRRRVADGANEG